MHRTYLDFFSLPYKVHSLKLINKHIWTDVLSLVFGYDPGLHTDYFVFCHILPYNITLDIKIYIYWTIRPTCCKDGSKESHDEEKNLHFVLFTTLQAEFQK